MDAIKNCADVKRIWFITRERRDSVELCKKLMYLRQQQDMTQQELAEKLDVSRQAVSRWERGEGKPSTEKLIAIGKLFDVSIDVLVDESLEVPKRVPVTAVAIEENPADEGAKTQEEAAAPPPAVPVKARRWQAVLMWAGILCALLIGIAALMGIYSINQRLEPDNIVPAEEIDGMEVESDVIMTEPIILQPLQP